MFLKLFSYLFPITIFKQKSTVSQLLEVIWFKGELVLDSMNTNYSYGNLQRILRKGLKKIGFKRIKNMNQILVLGVAAGSVIKTLVDEIHFKGQITGVDIDPAVIEIAKKYFHIDEIKNLNLIIEDAFKFVLKSNHQYDLIIIDVFEDTTMPTFLFQAYFTDRICMLLNNKGYILFNTIVLNEANKQRNIEFLELFDTEKYAKTIYRKFEESNELILIENKY